MKILSPSLIALLAAAVPAQGAPTSAQQALERMIGTWAYTGTDHLSGETVTVEGVEECTAICGGNWVLSRVRGTNMPFSGIGITGWDPTQQKIVSIWIDSNSPLPSESTGTFDKESGEMVLEGDWVMPDMTMHTRSVSRWSADGTRTSRTHVVGGEQSEDRLAMVLTSTRLGDDAALPAPATAAKETSADAPALKVAAHDLFARYAGTWEAEVTMTMPGMPAMQPSVMKQEDMLVCDGLWLHSTAHSSFMGMPYEGCGLMGYDPNTEEYVSFYVDSFSPQRIAMRGSFDPETKTITFRGKSTGPTGQPTDSVTTHRFIDDDHQTAETKATNADGSDAGTMTMKYRRVK